MCSTLSPRSSLQHTLNTFNNAYVMHMHFSTPTLAQNLHNIVDAVWGAQARLKPCAVCH